MYSGVRLRAKDLRYEFSHNQVWTMQLVDEAEVMKTRSHEVFMPALSSTMTEGKIVQWLKKEGDFVTKGEIVMVVESDKADMDVESFDEGYVARILVPEGGSAPVGSTVALLAESKGDIEKVRECGLDCVISGGGSRHDGTTAVETKHMPDTPFAASLDEESKDENLGANGMASKIRPTEEPQKPNFGEVFMPALSSTMTEGKIVEWLKEEGDAVQKGENVMVVESDKADMDVECFDSGFLAHIGLEAGASAKVGEIVAYIAKTKEEIANVKAWAKSEAHRSEQVESPMQNSQNGPEKPFDSKGGTDTLPLPKTGRIIASPYARKCAKEMGIDLSSVRGTGPGGRIVHKDVLRAKGDVSSKYQTFVDAKKMIATPGAEKASKRESVDLRNVSGTGKFGRITEEDVLRKAGKHQQIEKDPLVFVSADPVLQKQEGGPTTVGRTTSAMPAGGVSMNAQQKAVVRTMDASLSVPVFRVSYSIDTTEFDVLYSKVKSKGVTVSALLAKAASLALSKHPVMNARYLDGSIVFNREVNIAMALSLPDGGLITPVLKKVDSKDLYSLSREWKSLVKKALEKKLAPEDYSTGTFCISNLGMLGVDSFDAILPPNTGAILAVAASKPRVVVQKNGLIGAHKEMKVTVTCDHRHIYGAQAAEFLRELARIIESDVETLLM